MAGTTQGTDAGRANRTTGRDLVRRATETKAATKTTEFYAYIVAVIGVLVAAAATTADGNSENDVFSAEKAWLFVTLLTIGYMVSRGLAKAGSRDPYTEDRDSDNR